MKNQAKMSRRIKKTNMHCRIENSFATQNRLLRGATEALKQCLLSERSEVAQLHASLQLLRDVNENLLLATIGFENQKKAAETENSHQTMFLSMLAHELRNPIASISVANSLMLRAKMCSPMAKRMAGIVGRQVVHLQRLVDDLLDVARINTGKISLQKTFTELNDVISSALELGGHCLTLRRQIAVMDLPATSVLLFGDSSRLAQLFSNLVINASKFSPTDSTIFITASTHDSVLTVCIRDNGIGIASEDHLHIFDMFSQAKNTSEFGTASGLGIGLALVKSIAELHDGSVSVASEGINCGSEFRVTLPLASAYSASPLGSVIVNKDVASAITRGPEG